ncbi:hypothetical protein ALC53_04669 [Atta colombica]|uniref:Uncharacterized protein n=1 Tax=Atta colombica TaxID=520822 RepID=A0A195BJR1_9HYME|nr:hypothetical protein ALC53_04669 [Atta colombica]
MGPLEGAEGYGGEENASTVYHDADICEIGKVSNQKIHRKCKAGCFVILYAAPVGIKHKSQQHRGGSESKFCEGKVES